MARTKNKNVKNYTLSPLQKYSKRHFFYGDYKELNDVKIPNIADIRFFQLQKIDEFQRASFNIQKGEYASFVNEIFKSNMVNETQYEKEEIISLKASADGILKMLDYAQSNFKTINQQDIDNNSKEWQSLQELCKSLTTTFGFIAKQYSSSKIISSTYLSEISNICSSKNIEDWNILFGHLNQIKGDYLENLGVAWLRERQGLWAINTGKLNVQDSKLSQSERGQLIQDIMIMDLTKVDLTKLIRISYKDNRGAQIITLQELFELLDKDNNSSQQIIISDSGYDLLKSISALNIQSKAGERQLPWNTQSERSKISINDFSNLDNWEPISVKRTFELLHGLNSKWLDPTSGEELNLLANYGLATALFKVLHLNSFNGNEYLLTRDGFITFTERFFQLFENSKSYAYLVGGVLINKNTLNNKYSVEIKNYS